MSLDPLLVIHNIGFFLSAVLIIGLIIFIYFKDRHPLANKMMMAGFACVAIFSISHLIGVNVADGRLSRGILTFNLSTIFIGVFLTHATLAIIGKLEQRKKLLAVIYTVSIAMTILFLSFPDTFLLPSIPKMYFPNYYEAGGFYWVLILWNVAVALYSIVELALTYRTSDPVMQNRIKYLGLGYLLGYGFGSLAYLLVVNIPVDPVWAAFYIPLFSIPYTYGIIKYNLMDIRVVTKRAVLFGALVAGLSFGIFLVGDANSFLTSALPSFPEWIVPLMAGLAATLIGVFFWNKFKESDLLKYEFVTIMAHKLRTPLTSIKWSAEGITDMVPPEGRQELVHIKEGVNKLVELSNILADVSSEDRAQYEYRYALIDFAGLTRAVISEYSPRAASKSISLDAAGVSPEPLMVRADEAKLKVLLQTLIDNALIYTPEKGRAAVLLTREGKNALLAISDTGIGFSKEESRLIFSRLFRTDAARKAATEGMGVGLYLAKGIVERHGGRIWMQSEGQGKGSTFFVSLPVPK